MLILDFRYDLKGQRPKKSKISSWKLEKEKIMFKKISSNHIIQRPKSALRSNLSPELSMSAQKSKVVVAFYYVPDENQCFV